MSAPSVASTSLRACSAIHYLHLLRESNCKLVTTEGNELTSDDFAAFILAGYEGQKSESEQRDKSHRVLTEMLSRAKRGEWLGGRVPFGMDVAAFRVEAGGLREQWRVQIVGERQRIRIDTTGRTDRYDGRDNFPPAHPEEVLQLRPTRDEAKLAVIRNIFEWFDTEATNPNAVARRLNTEKIDPPPYSKHWSQHLVHELLANPVYVGRPGWNKRSSGNYSMFRNGEEVKKKPNQPTVIHDRADWIMPEQPLFEPVVSLDLWQRVQQKLADRPKSARAPKSAKLWLARLVVCGKCGKPMSGKFDPKDGKPKYICSTYVKLSKAKSPCTSNIVHQSEIEDYLNKWFDLTGEQLSGVLEATNRDELLPWEVGEATHKMIAAHRAMRERLRLPDPCGIDVADLSEQYGRVFDKERPTYESALQKYEDEHERLLDRLGRLPASAKLGIEKTQKLLVEVEQRITETNALLTNQSDAWLDDR